MRVAYVCADAGVPVFGRKGSSVHVQEVVRAFQRAGAEVHLFASRLAGEPSTDLIDVPGHHLRCDRAADASDRERQGLMRNDSLYGLLRREGPFDLVYERYSLWSHAAMEYARDTGTPAVLEVNAPLIEEQATYRELVDRAAAERVAARAFDAATVVIAVSIEVAERVASHAGNGSYIHVVPNGVDPARFCVSPESGGATDARDFTVGFVGSMRPWHDLQSLVEAFDEVYARDCNSRLLLVGDGPERERLDAQIGNRESNLREAVYLTGAIGPEEIPEQLAKMDVAVAPYADSAEFYFSPLKVYEYMAAGLPVVASRVGQLAGLIEGGRNGLLYAPGDVRQLAAALIRLREDRELRLSLGRAARSTVVRDHTWMSRIERILDLVGLRPPVAYVGREGRA